ncbi:efflux RND transporter periplasmic adaptor subunit [Rahnella sp. SL6]|uniref:HlyD family secretion protein n=1 Tax=Rahnella perminowiae TaxID=2816244 RepID=UPI001C26EC0E|nr:efflux RND transporter periplasmic adaptor subunit [Rahnella perminowiae]MBU9812510.1 efflux RND transporter periplasmic adaptor subunit [Rahnella perminowiae]
MSKRILLTLLLIAVAVSLAVLFRAHNQDLLLQGEVDAPEVIVASKAKGRVTERHVERGDDVKAGQLLITLDSPELMAQLRAAEAARDQAKAQLDLSVNGTREESIRNLKATLAQSQAEYINARDLYNRNAKMASKGFISAADLEDSRRARDSAYQQVLVAKANLDEGVNGDRVEQRESYAAQLRQAEEDLLEVKAQADDLLVKAPVDGEVGPIPVEVGELQNASSPLLTLVRLPDAYFVFNLREDILAGVRKGDKVRIRVPALNNQMIEAEVRYLAPLGDYATKRATRATGDFDLKTFEVRLYPAKPVPGLRQGMSALWQWQAQ